MSGKDYKQAITDYRNKIAAQLRTVYDKAGMPVPPELDAQLKGAAAPRTGHYDAAQHKVIYD